MSKLANPARKRTVPASMTGRVPGQVVPVYLKAGIRRSLPGILGPPCAVELVTDRNVARHWYDEIREALRRAGFNVHSTILTAGERTKNAKTVAALHESWFAHGCDRGTPVVALGGGVVGDTAGFAAATFMRGLPLLQIPTTILAQVDAAIGGKVGINHARGKNLIGCIYQPSGIIIDPEFLATLPAAEIRSGLAEVVKYGVIADPALFNRCESGIREWLNGRSPVPASVMAKCIRIKLRIVELDERESGLRRILNFGHTLGHAIERAAGYRGVRHGEAVAIGMAAAAWIATQKRRMPRSDRDRLLDVCMHLLPQRRLRIAEREVSPHLLVDKKRTGGRNVWILPRRIGEVEANTQVTEKDVRGAVGFLNEWIADRNPG